MDPLGQRPRASSIGRAGLVADYCDDNDDDGATTRQNKVVRPATVAMTAAFAAPVSAAAPVASSASSAPDMLPPQDIPGQTSLSSAPAPVSRDAMTDDDASMALPEPPPPAVPSTDESAAVPAPPPVVYRRLAALPPESTDEPPPGIMDKMRQYWAATSRVRAAWGGPSLSSGEGQCNH